MKKINITQFLVTLALSTILWALHENWNVALSFLIGAALIWYVIISWSIGMSFIFQKKYIALAIGIIVFKYAILGVIIFWFVRQTWTQPLWFALGVASFVVSALVYAVLEAFKEDDKNVI